MKAERPSPWTTPFAWRTYGAGVAWSLGLLVSWLTGVPDIAGWLTLRTDTGGLLFLSACAIGGVNFVGAGLRAAARLQLNMNFLMSAALVSALMIGEPFEAATLAFLFSAAELLERYAIDRGRRAIAALVALAPEKADVLNDDGSTRTLPVADLQVGDRVRVRPGDKIPADGTVVAGHSSVNEATITGESLPRSKQTDDVVFAGTLNGDGALDVLVNADAKNSAIARIVQLVREAQSRRAPTERFVQRFARVYTPIIVVASLFTAMVPSLLGGGADLVWIARAITLLVIACPCALVIATPVTMVSALTSAARQGVLVKGGDHLEALGGIRAMAVDKTGTLTTGQLAVEDFRVSTGANEGELLEQVASVEARSEHPVAAALTRFAATRGAKGMLPVAEFSAVQGKGVRAVVTGITLDIGSEEYMGAALSAPFGEVPPGATRIYARTAAGDVAAFTLRDAVRSEAARVIAANHRLGIRPVVLLSGDSLAAADAVGREVGVDEVRARLLPHEKVAAVEGLRATYGSIAMLGDGINDAPALAAANVGLAMGAAGAAATIEAADVALMADDLTRLPYVIALSRRTRSTIRYNIAIALGLKLGLA
ncbi:MAG: heavy metal translocating P-type ATPase, partial [Gemmatimonadota bacterium]